MSFDSEKFSRAVREIKQASPVATRVSLGLALASTVMVPVIYYGAGFHFLDNLNIGGVVVPSYITGATLYGVGIGLDKISTAHVLKTAEAAKKAGLPANVVETNVALDNPKTYTEYSEQVKKGRKREAVGHAMWGTVSGLFPGIGLAVFVSRSFASVNNFALARRYNRALSYLR